MPNVCIAGAGVIGCATALELAASGAQVTLVERGRLGGESSWAGAGLLSALLPWQYPDEVTQLVEWGRRAWGDWARALQETSGVDPEYWPCGMLVLPPFDVGAALAWGERYGQQVDWMREQTALPLLAHERQEALWLPGVAQVRNPRLLRALRGALLRRGVKVLEHTEVRQWSLQDDRIMHMETSRGPLSADLYVISAGAWSGELCPGLNAPLPIRPIRGQIVLLKGEAGRLPHVLYADGLYAIPRQDGHILLGSTLEDVGFDRSTSPVARADLLARARAILPFLGDLPVVGHWAGLRPGSPENIPIMDRHPRLKNLFMNSGHFRYGVTMAPAAAVMLTNLILGHPSPVDPTAYRWPH